MNCEPAGNSRGPKREIVKEKKDVIIFLSMAVGVYWH